MNARILPVLLLLFLLPLTASAEVRKWTNTAGVTVEGEFVAQDPTKVRLRLKSGKLATVEKSSLSPEDLLYLSEQPVDGLDAPPSRPLGELVFDTHKPGSMEIKSASLGFGSTLFQKHLVSPHFYIVSTAKMPDETLRLYAETGERLQAQITAEWEDLGKALEGRRTVVFLTSDEDEAKSLGTWASTQTAMGIPFAWHTTGVQYGIIPATTQTELKLLPSYRWFLFHMKDTHSKSPKHESRIHFLANSLLWSYLSGFDYYTAGDENISLLVGGWSHYFEAGICGKIDTFIRPPEGFKNLRSWADPLKRLAKDPQKGPNLVELMKQIPDKATSTEIAWAYSLIHFAKSDTTRWRRFQALFQAPAGAKTPPPTSMDVARALGATSVEECNEKWRQFVLSSSFK
jgi:hypothetical protein